MSEMHSVDGHTADDADKFPIISADAPSHGGASHNYTLAWRKRDGEVRFVRIPFQFGPVKEHGVNGVTERDLLVILIDRLEAFQSGPYACEENARTLDHLNQALYWTTRRASRRIKAGTEGTSAGT